jgi:hypothetical protein
MTTTTHSAPEDIMALLDGELSAADAQALSAHLADCPACASVADQFRDTARMLSTWSVPPLPVRVEQAVRETAADPRHRTAKSRARIRPNTWNWKQWTFGSAGAAAILLFTIAIVSNSPRHLTYNSPVPENQTASEPMVSDGLPPSSPAKGQPIAQNGYNGNLTAVEKAVAGLTDASTRAQRSASGESRAAAPHSSPAAPAPPIPMIARTLTLSILVKDIPASRPSLDAILARHHGYIAQLNVSTQQDAPRSFQASLRIPAPELAATLAELKAFGRVLSEEQSGEEVTQQHADLAARLQNARETEDQLRGILQQRTGRVSDILEVEEEIARVRGEIESMEAEQQALEHRVDFAEVNLTLTEDYKAALSSPDSATTRMHNAFVAGYRNAVETLLDLLLFLEEFGPTLFIWLTILAVPAFFLYRRYRKHLDR